MLPFYHFNLPDMRIIKRDIWHLDLCFYEVMMDRNLNKFSDIWLVFLFIDEWRVWYLDLN